jgi:acyl-CoA thioesterase FadM
MGEVFAPFAAYRSEVQAEWLDYNGHMHDSSYGIALSDANEELFVRLGLSAEYRASTGASLYTVESHLRYLAECTQGHTLSAHTRVLDADEKRVLLYTELFRDDDVLVATGEVLYLHVDTTAGATTPMPADRQARVRELLASHATLPRPDGLLLQIRRPASSLAATDG